MSDEKRKVRVDISEVSDDEVAAISLPSVRQAIREMARLNPGVTVGSMHVNHKEHSNHKEHTNGVIRDRSIEVQSENESSVDVTVPVSYTDYLEKK